MLAIPLWLVSTCAQAGNSEACAYVENLLTVIFENQGTDIIGVSGANTKRIYWTLTMPESQTGSMTVFSISTAGPSKQRQKRMKMTILRRRRKHSSAVHSRELHTEMTTILSTEVNSRISTMTPFNFARTFGEKVCNYFQKAFQLYFLSYYHLISTSAFDSLYYFIIYIIII